MSFLEIKDPTKHAVLVNEYVTVMKTVKQRNMANREMKQAVGDELQTLFHPIVHATKQVAEETRKELAPMKKALTDIDGSLAAQLVEAPSETPLNKNTDTTFGIHRRQDGQVGIGNKEARIDANGKTLSVDDTGYKLTPGLFVLITKKHPRAGLWNSNDYQVYKSLVAQTKVKSFPNRTGASRPHATWKWMHMLKKMAIPGERIAEVESEDTDGTDSVKSYPDIASIGDIGESSDISSPGMLSFDPGISSSGPSIPPSLPTCSYGKARKTKKEREPFYKGYGVVYLCR